MDSLLIRVVCKRERSTCNHVIAGLILTPQFKRKLERLSIEPHPICSHNLEHVEAALTLVMNSNFVKLMSVSYKVTNL